MTANFSATQREDKLRDMESQELDLIIIGGGITGAGIALDASQRGLRVGLLEKGDFASGTSSRSTKLIHGGLRYLKQGEINLVREVGKERAILYRNAPHLVIPAPMLLPIHQGGTFGYFASSVGLYLYDWLAGVNRQERRKMLNKQQAMQQEPLLKTNGLKGAGYYFEYRTDDARLTLDTIKTAAAHGASIVNYAQVKDFVYESGKVLGVSVADQVSGKQYVLRARYIVNSAGPWVDQIRHMDGSLEGKRLFLTKGVHLVVDYIKLPVRQSAYFDTPDGRMVFVIPRGTITYIGTTDTAYSEQSIEHPRTTAEDRDYLIGAVNAMFPEVNLQPKDIISHWAGLRPLIYEEGKGPSELSRKDEVFVSPSGLISIAGGKLTGYRKMAEKIVDLVTKRASAEDGKTYPGCRTDHVVISGGETQDNASFADWKTLLIQMGIQREIDQGISSEWVDTYGSNTLKIYERYDALLHDNDVAADERALHAQVAYSISEEMTLNAADFLRLRTGWMFFNPQRVQQEWQTVIRIMAEILGWDTTEKERQAEEVLRELNNISQLPHNHYVRDI